MSFCAKYFNEVLIICLIIRAVAMFDCGTELLKVCRCVVNVNAAQYIVDCSNSGLDSVPKSLPRETTHLYLDNNNLSYLQRNSFSTHYSRLEVLSIRNNKLEKVNSGSFENLDNLKQLFLYNNSLQYSYSFPKSLFIPLRSSVEILDIRMNIGLKFLGYPISVAELYSLEELRMDIIRDQPLPQEYSNMSKLHKLIFMGGRSNVVFLNDNTFEALSTLNISEINLGGLDIGMIGRHTFSDLSSLRQLDLSNNPNFYINLGIIADSLHRTSIRILRLNNTGIGNSRRPTSILKNFCNLPLEELTLDGNFLRYLSHFLLEDCFPDIRVLSIADNYFLMDIPAVFMKNLVGLNMSYQYLLSDSRPNKNSYDRIFSNRREMKEHYCIQGMACPIILAPKLLWIDISHSGLFIANLPELAFLTNSTLKYLNISYCAVQTISLPIYCPRTGVIPQLETVDFSNNNLQCINASVFNENITNCDWRSLKRLYLGNNKLGQIDGNICNKDKSNIFGFLEPFHSLMVLDISGNKQLSDKKLMVVETLSHMQELDLSANNFQNFTLNLKNFTQLKKLDLSFNNIECLSKSTIMQLNKFKKLNRQHSIIEVDLTGNLLACQCECLSFFQWMTTAHIYLRNNKTYECVFDNKKRGDSKQAIFNSCTVGD